MEVQVIISNQTYFGVNRISLSKVKEYVWSALLMLAYGCAAIFGRGLIAVVYFFLYRVVRYRSRVIDQNLLMTGIADLSNVDFIRKAYYKQLARYVVESVYGFFAPASKLAKNIHFTNLSLLEGFLSQDKSVIIIASHYGNWEWVVPMLGKVCTHPVVGVYKPLSDKALDAVMYRRRSRFGLIMASMGEVVRYIKTSNLATAYVLLADQSPSKAEAESVAEFFDIETFFISGPKKLSQRFDMVVLNQTIKSVSSGYEVSFTELDSGDLPTNYAKMLEADIKSAPEFWLWSHKRWKLNDYDQMEK